MSDDMDAKWEGVRRKDGRKFPTRTVVDAADFHEARRRCARVFGFVDVYDPRMSVVLLEACRSATSRRKVSGGDDE